MTINFNKATFLTSAAKLSQLPPAQGLEVAFAGRSNVGKSSALNTLTRQKNLARTSKTPGRTQLINFFTLDENHRLVDLPGYGYAKVSRDIKNRWQKTLGQYLETRACLAGIVLLMDIRHPLKDYDLTMANWADHFQIPTHILLTKADKLSRNQMLKSLTLVSKELSHLSCVSIQAFSSANKLGLPELEQKLRDWLSS